VALARAAAVSTRRAEKAFIFVFFIMALDLEETVGFSVRNLKE
jgi:hypothetical protein